MVMGHGSGSDRRLIAAAVLWLGAGSVVHASPAPVHAQQTRPPGPRDVAVGDALRRTLLDALRPTVERDLGQPVRFVVHRLRAMDGYAFAELVPQTPTGAPIDLARTRHAERLREGMMDGDHIFALLRQKGGSWQVRDWVIGPTDVVWAGWSEAHGAPEALFAAE